MTDIRNIILFGRTGNGKSTLANVLTKSPNFFTESAGSVSETREIQIKEFEEEINSNGEEAIKYRVIDTVGIGDTRLTEQGVLYKIAEACHYIKDGLNQILFITNGRFTKEEIDTFGLLKSVVFDADVSKYTTIVRTNFPEFEDELKCQQDQQQLRAENPAIFKILSATRIIYVDNPPLKGRTASINQEIRKDSRKRLLVHLATCQGTYRPQNLDAMNDRIGNYMTETEKIQQELKNLKKLAEQQQKLSQEEKMKLIEQIRSLEEQGEQLKHQIANTTGGFFSEILGMLFPVAQMLDKAIGKNCQIS
ncbi:3820_t:CDS:1 [Ambispora leptoticha]|uniref:3820_t:CDS:1 n=1 Tax=Ambispora leptoticha TaxID=144679 RepID=A0A9N9DLJ6_9GLOM|nr:3820_t:CDS:1 [Ambispora leptoticha]